jgi:carbon starvation protein
LRADFIVLIVIVLYLLGYKFYSRFLEKHIFKIDDSLPTPAHEINDGEDFVPTRKTILFGHHFASIAGVAPIIGPCIAVYWGWLPALLWVVIGNITMGAVHDMGTLYLSVRNCARSIADVAGNLLGKRSKLSLLFIIVFLLWIVSAAFSVVIARLFVSYPASVIPTAVASILAIFMGFLLYRWKIHALVPSLICLALLYASIPLGVSFPVDLSSILGVEAGSAVAIWVLFLLVYAYVASVLPVWVLLQPRDYINSHQIIVGLGLLVFGIFFTQPQIVAPAINHNATQPWFPFLFITVACGAISGAHGLIASGTTSRQINKESDIRPIGYGSMLLEGFLALLAVMAATAGFRDYDGWCNHYGDWAHASTHALDAFVNGCVGFLDVLGLDPALAAAFIAVIIISFASTSLDTLFRIQRYMLEEISELADFKPLANKYLGSLVAVISSILLVYSDGVTNLDGAFRLWPLFGTTNQLIAALALLVLAVYLMVKNTNNIVILVPGLLLTLLTVYANCSSAYGFFVEKNYLLSTFSLLILILQIDISRTVLLFMFRSKLAS